MLRKNLVLYYFFPWTYRDTHLRKGGNPHNSMYVITPAAQISTFKPYLRKQDCVTCVNFKKRHSNKKPDYIYMNIYLESALSYLLMM